MRVRLVSKRTASVTRTELEDLDTLCAGVVTRNGEQDACCKPATAVILETEDSTIWPACTYHAHRYGSGTVYAVTLTLAQMREAMANGCVSVEHDEVPQW